MNFIRIHFSYPTVSFPCQDIIATGGVDTNAVIFDQPSGQILSTLGGHSKKVTSVKFVGRDNLVITGSADKVSCTYIVFFLVSYIYKIYIDFSLSSLFIFISFAYHSICLFAWPLIILHTYKIESLTWGFCLKHG